VAGVLHLSSPRTSTDQCSDIWYHRTDLGLAWDDVEQRFSEYFGEKREKGGLQCKFYRTIGDAGVEKVREQTNSGRR
jgi:hypothetical protein